jgi:cyclase
MLLRRVIVCLDVDGGRVVKGRQFVGLRDVGDPVALAERYEDEGADEIVFLDISATADDRQTMWDVVKRTAERLFIPLTLGGGVRDVDDVARALRSGADKVSMNSAAVARPALLTEAAERFGAQCVVASIDAKRRGSNDGWEVYVRGGRQATGRDAIAWAEECVERGAGEILLTSIDRDGSRVGYDIALTRAVADRVGVPVVASGGAGTAEHLVAAFRDGHAGAALVAGILHDRETTVRDVKQLLAERGIPVRPTPEISVC